MNSARIFLLSELNSPTWLTSIAAVLHSTFFNPNLCLAVPVVKLSSAHLCFLSIRPCRRRYSIITRKPPARPRLLPILLSHLPNSWWKCVPLGKIPCSPFQLPFFFCERLSQWVFSLFPLSPHQFFFFFAFPDLGFFVRACCSACFSLRRLRETFAGLKRRVGRVDPHPDCTGGSRCFSTFVRTAVNFRPLHPG